MNNTDVLVVGGGAAGVAAATALAHQGLTVVLSEQRDRLGGAIHRAHVGPGRSTVGAPARHRRRWNELASDLVSLGDAVDLRFETIFLGVDGDGRLLLDDRKQGRVVCLRAKAVVLAMGALETVEPRPGWELPGVTTAGGMQVQLKETGRAPEGPILIAGTGPLNLALAAQLTAAGNPPVAVLELGQPWRSAWRHPGAALDALRDPAKVWDAIGYGARLLTGRVPYRSGWAVTSIVREGNGLKVSCAATSGDAARDYLVHHLAVHDGLVPNAVALPATDGAQMLVVRAGDCREILGADGAIHDGWLAAERVAAVLGRPFVGAGHGGVLVAARRSQDALAVLCQPVAQATPMTDSTVLCRCEGLRRSDLDLPGRAQSAREIRLLGRFGMGVCQGRFCARFVAQQASEHGVIFGAADLEGATPRWPLRPVSVSALAACRDE
jgi:D-hydroxyproline dehydrogenase subunit alpha